MAERVVSPGVFTNEIDVSFLPAAVSNIGAALVGICKKGPAYVPTVVESYNDFQIKFGGTDPSFFLPYTAKSYLKNSGTATIVRVLGTSGYVNTNAVVLTGGGATGVSPSASIAFSSSFSGFHSGSVGAEFTSSAGVHNHVGDDFSFAVDGTTYKFEPWTGSSFTVDGPGQFGIGELAQAATSYFGEDVDPVYKSGTTYFWQIGGDITQSAVNVVGAINAAYSTTGVSASLGTTLNDTFICPAYHTTTGLLGAGSQGEDWGFSVQLTGSVGTALNSKTISTSGTGGYLTTTSFSSSFVFDGGVQATDKKAYAVLFPTASAGNLTNTTITGTGGIASASSFQVNWQGHSNPISPVLSLNPSDANYVESVLGNKPVINSGHPAYVYKIFKYGAKSLSNDTQISAVTATTTIGSYSAASTPMILSQTGSNGLGTDLFKLETISDGTSANTEIKVGITNIKKAGTIAGSDYGSFDVVVRKFGDTDKRPEVLESFTGCTLDKDSPGYVVRKIGDYKKSYTNNKVVIDGDFPNKSKYIRLTNVNDSIKQKTLGSNLVPFGFGSYVYPFNTTGGFGSISIVDLPIRTNQSSSGEFSAKLYHGVNFDTGSADITIGSGLNSNAVPYFSPIPSATEAHMTSSKFDLGKDCGVTLDSGIAHKKFILGFQGGNDGWDETRTNNGPNNDGTAYGLGKALPSVVGSSDETAFKNAIGTLSNPDEVDINMLVIPGINSSDHGGIHTKARETVEDRADSFYVFDAGNYNASNADVISQVEAEDSNYSATYWPWVKLFDEENNTHVWAPPSTVVPGVIAFTDKIAHPWFAPAGLNRGGLTEVLMAKERLTHGDRDDLYDARVNPIATFPGEGVVVWGQKTLQAKPSALDRVNVRRLLISLKKFIASSSRFLVFEQNTNATRQRFLNIVNPYMEQVQSNSGLSAFRVVMDETNNTPDVVDRNELRGQIFIQPTRTAEFIVLDFIVQPSGATFPE